MLPVLVDEKREQKENTVFLVFDSPNLCLLVYLVCSFRKLASAEKRKLEKDGGKEV